MLAGICVQVGQHAELKLGNLAELRTSTRTPCWLRWVALTTAGRTFAQQRSPAVDCLRVQAWWQYVIWIGNAYVAVAEAENWNKCICSILIYTGKYNTNLTGRPKQCVMYRLRQKYSHEIQGKPNNTIANWRNCLWNHKLANRPSCN